MFQKNEFPTLQQLALDTVAAHYHLYPELTGLKERYKQIIIEKSIEHCQHSLANLAITAPHITQQKYWKACCQRDAKLFKSIKLEDHGFSYKVAYIEKYAQKIIQEMNVEEDAEAKQTAKTPRKQLFAAKETSRSEQRMMRTPENAPDNQKEQGEDITKGKKQYSGMQQGLEILRAVHPWIFNLDFKVAGEESKIKQICRYLPNLVGLKIRCTEGKNVDYKKPIVGLKFAEAHDISEVLRTTQSLLSLNLSGNLIDDEIWKFVAPGLTLNTTLVHLNLSYNKIGDLGARRLSKFLIKNQILTELNLSNNVIGFDGSRYLAQALKLNSTLEVLSLKLNSISDKAGAKFFKDLAFNTCLRQLDFQANSLATMSMRKICLYLAVPNSLRLIRIGSNDFLEEELAIILAALPSEHSRYLFSKSKHMQIQLQ